MVRMGTRSLISDSSTSREISSHQKTFIATEIETAQERSRRAARPARRCSLRCSKPRPSRHGRLTGHPNS